MGKIRTYKEISATPYMDRGVVVRIFEECKEGKSGKKKCKYTARMDPYSTEFSAKSISEIEDIVSGELENHPVLQWEPVISIDTNGREILKVHGFTGWSIDSFDVSVKKKSSGQYRRKRMWIDESHVSRTLETAPPDCKRFHVGIAHDYELESSNETLIIPYTEYAMIKFDNLTKDINGLQDEFAEWAKRTYRAPGYTPKVGEEPEPEPEPEPTLMKSSFNKTYNLIRSMSVREVDDVYKFAVERSRQIVDGE